MRFQAPWQQILFVGNPNQNIDVFYTCEPLLWLDPRFICLSMPKSA